MEFEARTREGLVKGHAYTCKLPTEMLDVDTPEGTIPILRIRNPWGNEQEWNGDWSDESELWEGVSRKQKREMNLVIENDGEMSFDDYLKHFDKMEICNLGPDRGLHSTVYDSFACNPQFGIEISGPDPEDADGLCTVIFAVLQKNRRELKQKGLDNLAIGFAVDKIYGPLDRNFFATHKSTARSAAFINLREVRLTVTGRFRLPPGSYVVVPSTFEPGEEGEFMLRVFTNVTITSEELG
uniref:Calpain catalytic domain-containing protein n=1 Tax=Parascaris equorum TaxID=6256 RepID=A0A914RME9_PAREQ